MADVWVELVQIDDLTATTNEELLNLHIYRAGDVGQTLTYEQVKKLNQVLATWIQDYQTRNGDQK